MPALVLTCETKWSARDGNIARYKAIEQGCRQSAAVFFFFFFFFFFLIDLKLHKISRALSARTSGNVLHGYFNCNLMF